MKKRFHIYCTLFLLSIGCGIAIDAITEYEEISDSFSAGWNSGWNSAYAQKGEEGSYKYYDIAVSFRPVSATAKDATFGTDSVYNVIAKEKEEVHYNNVVMHIGNDKVEWPSFGENILGLGSLLYIIGIIGFWYFLIVIVRYFRNGDVFLHDIANSLTKAAVFLLVSYLAEWIIIWAWHEMSTSMVELEGYEIVPHFDYNNTHLYISFGLLLLAQIIKYGKEMKEENELTI